MHNPNVISAFGSGIRPRERDGGRSAARAQILKRKTQESSSPYDPNWAICPDGGSNNYKDYQRHFPTCEGRKCLYSCDAAWGYYTGQEVPLDFSYELTIRAGVDGATLTAALMDMEEKMLIHLAENVGIDDCICSTMNGQRGVRGERGGRGGGNAIDDSPEMPEGQNVVNLSNLIRDEILPGKCKDTIAKEGEACISMLGHMRFVHTVEDGEQGILLKDLDSVDATGIDEVIISKTDNSAIPVSSSTDYKDEDVRRILSYDGALTQLNDLLDQGMANEIFLDADVAPEDRIITGMTFVPETNEDDNDDGDSGEGEESSSLGTAGTAPVDPKPSPSKNTTVVITLGPPGTDIGGNSGLGAVGATRGENTSKVSYGLYGLFVLVALAPIAAIGLFMRRRQHNEDDDNSDADLGLADTDDVEDTTSNIVEVDPKTSLELDAAHDPATSADASGSFPQPAYNLNLFGLGQSASEDSAAMVAADKAVLEEWRKTVGGVSDN